MLLITGGLGYIGSHITLAYHQKFPNEKILIIDNLGNSSKQRIHILKELTNNNIIFYPTDLTHYQELFQIFHSHKITKVIHCAGWKAVGESVQKPLMYYENNILSTIHLLKAMNEFNIHKLVFSSSATVYGVPQSSPLNENHPIQPNQPYGKTKAFIEHIIKDTASIQTNNKFISLRYFNPTGAHPCGKIPEKPSGYPNNLFPAILAASRGEIPELKIFASPGQTRDGTGVRDYLHVVDLARAHLDCLDYLDRMNENYNVLNFGSGVGYSVREVIEEFEKQLGKKIQKSDHPPREGDVDEVIADVRKWNEIFGWIPTTPLSEMVRTALLIS
jgi:UDP-glucose 4-epimerase